MKTLKNSIVLFAVLFFPTAAVGGIDGSFHDFSAANWSGKRICLPCHASHVDDVTPDAPLWNRKVNRVTYKVYSGLSVSADYGQPSSISKLCLSCHDGITALDSYSKRNGSVLLKSAARLGSDLNSHHPVSFVYDTASAILNGGLKNPLTTSSGLGGTIAQDLLVNNKVECTSCHDVHNEKDNLRFILKDSGVNKLCLTCHTEDGLLKMGVTEEE